MQLCYVIVKLIISFLLTLFSFLREDPFGPIIKERNLFMKELLRF